METFEIRPLIAEWVMRDRFEKPTRVYFKGEFLGVIFSNGRYMTAI